MSCVTLLPSQSLFQTCHQINCLPSLICRHIRVETENPPSFIMHDSNLCPSPVPEAEVTVPTCPGG